MRRMKRQFGMKLRDESLLTYMFDSESQKGRNKGFFLCECGNIKEACVYSVKAGHTRSCGCIHKKQLAERNKRNSTHGMTHHPLYNTYNQMKIRCLNTESDHYFRYGGAGVEVCDRWLKEDGEGFRNFLEDMGERPDGTQLDRINPYGHYEPANCRWASYSEQAYNKRRELVAGIYPSGKSRWSAEIHKDSVKYRLGIFNSYEDACKARIEKEMELYGYSTAYGDITRSAEV